MTKKTVVYIGPTIESVVLTGTAFYGGYPPGVTEALKRNPYLQDLMIPAEKLAEAKKTVRDPESSLGVLYRRAERRGV